MTVHVDVSVPKFFQGRHRYSYNGAEQRPAHWSLVFRVYKFFFDAVCTLVALPLIAVIGALLLVLNPFFNPGPLIFTQNRLGKNRVPFKMYKFRSMVSVPEEARAADAKVETHRITPLGRILRKLRIDELPNFFNVLRGEMSVIGPRPDAQSHAEEFLRTIPHYNYRYLVKPGITGLAQIESGYAEGAEQTSLKAHYDHLYVETSCGRLDVFIAWRTLWVMATGFGSK